MKPLALACAFLLTCVALATCQEADPGKPPKMLHVQISGPTPLDGLSMWIKHNDLGCNIYNSWTGKSKINGKEVRLDYTTRNDGISHAIVYMDGKLAPVGDPLRMFRIISIKPFEAELEVKKIKIHIREIPPVEITKQ